MAETKQPANAEKAAPLSAKEAAEIRATDEADTSPRQPEDTSGKRLRAVMWGGATEVVVNKRDFKTLGVEHGSVKFVWDKNSGTLPIGKGGISEEAAEALVRHDKALFEYFGDE